jgi:hypothetical protein
VDRLIPFSPDVYVSLFAQYNAAFWPALICALILGVAMLGCIIHASAAAGRMLALIVATYWIWTGWAFHIETYATLNWAAVPFGALFIVQGMVTIFMGTALGRFDVIAGRTRSVEIGATLLFVALLAHPVLTYLTGQPIETAHAFAITPASVALIAVATLYVVYGRAVLWLLVWPILWSAWDLASAWSMDLWRDAMLPALTLCAAAYLIQARVRR